MIQKRYDETHETYYRVKAKFLDCEASWEEFIDAREALRYVRLEMELVEACSSHL